MTDVPDDLTDVGTHHGNQPPTDTGQTVRSPEGPDPTASDAQPSPALFQLVRRDEQLALDAHSARAEVSTPNEGDEVGQYRTVEALRKALEEENVEETTAVFEDVEANRILIETDVTAEHPWIGLARYPTIRFFSDPDAATQYADEHDRPAPNS